MWGMRAGSCTLVLGVGGSGGLHDASRISQHMGANRTPTSSPDFFHFLCPPLLTQGTHCDLPWLPRVLSMGQWPGRDYF